jgi:fumarate hydratase class I
MRQSAIESDIIAATREATSLSYLRPNAVDPLTGRNSGDNVGKGAPVIHMHEWGKDHLVADLLLKGGGSENVSAIYSLPHGPTKASRDVDGVRRVVLDAVFEAQGKGCGPGIIGVGIGGDRATSMLEAKEQLFRSLDDTNQEPVLAGLEQRLYTECNELAIGPMGFGGKTTVLAVKAGARHRLPASFFVSVAYLCWAARRASVTISKNSEAVFAEHTHLGRCLAQGERS